MLATAVLMMMAAQTPVIGDIEIFGTHKITHEKVMKTLGIQPGDPLPPSKTRLEDALLAMDGVARASVEAVCCDAGKAILYIGIEERGGATFPLRDQPQGDLQLPEEIVQAYHDFTIALAGAARDGDTHEDIKQGHSMMDNIACNVIQKRFLGFAQLHLEVLKAVLRESEDEEQRAVAAYVLGYAPRKADVVNDLQLALRDPDPDVRANALRALKPIALLAQKDPELGIRVETTWFVEMLNSTVLKDRLEGVRTLLALTDAGIPAPTYKHLWERGLTPLEEMAHWRNLEYVLPAYLLLGRMAGVGDPELEQTWASGDREKKLQEIEQKLKSKN
jgi:hypothetical protein